MYGLSDDQRAMVERRQALVHVLGNLTLLTKPANLEVLNYAFDPEKPQIRSLFLTLFCCIRLCAATLAPSRQGTDLH